VLEPFGSLNRRADTCHYPGTRRLMSYGPDVSIPTIYRAAGGSLLLTTSFCIPELLKIVGSSFES
jgi:hypothetical protein